MKKILCIILTAMLLLTFTTPAYADTDYKEWYEQYFKNHKGKKQKEKKYKAKKVEYKLSKSPVIKFGRYKLPVNPVKKGMGAEVEYEKSVLTITKNDIIIVIDFKNETVSVNGVIDTDSNLFSPKNSRKMTVLIQYIAEILGIKVDVDDDEVIVEVPNLEPPTGVTLMPVGTTNISNTINASTLYLKAAATIKAGQATGGRAELYVGSRLVAVDTVINATDTTVTFDTSDGTPTIEELKAKVPEGGVVTVRLYNSKNEYVISKVSNPTLVVDYVAPTISGITSASLDTAKKQLTLKVTGAGRAGDKVDVTRISFYDSSQGRTYQLTKTAGTGSSGAVKDANTLTVNIGSVDLLGLTGFGGSDVHLIIYTGALIVDAAGNTSPSFNTSLTVPVTIAYKLDPPTKVSVTPVGSVTAVPNTLNRSTLYLTATANIAAGQATGGRAELYVGSKLVAADTTISLTDTMVTFNTSDGTPTIEELMAAVPAGGEVTVKLYNVNNETAVSKTNNPKLTVDYTAPTLTGITSAIYNTSAHQIYFTVIGAGAVGDKVDVTKISLYDSILGRTYQLTSQSNGTVNSENSLVINIGLTDRNGLTGFGTGDVYLTVAAGSLIKDDAENTSPIAPEAKTIPVIVIK